MNPHAKHGGLLAVYLAATGGALAVHAIGLTVICVVAAGCNVIEWRRAVRPRPIVLKRKRRFYD